jgi:hypothetical protein
MNQTVKKKGMQLSLSIAKEPGTYPSPNSLFLLNQNQGRIAEFLKDYLLFLPPNARKGIHKALHIIQQAPHC